jgi:sulfate permease, SulP family
MKWMNSLFPFLRWFPMTGATLQADLMAGITVALVLVPQSMAYAQLAGLPVVYGLYASFIPVIVASLWGSSNQLHTGPVAMLSLMSAAAVMSFATPGTADFIELSIMLALMVGILRFALGIFRLGAIVNVLSSPVIVGFTNAAALIIGLSQLNKVVGVPFPRSESYLTDVWQVIAQLPQLHWWTLCFAIGAWLLIVSLRKVSASFPAVLAAVAISIALSAVFGYEKTTTVSLAQVRDAESIEKIENYANVRDRMAELTALITGYGLEANELERRGGMDNVTRAQELRAKIAVSRYELDQLKATKNRLNIELHDIALQAAPDPNGALSLYPAAELMPDTGGDGNTWRFDGITEDGQVTFSAGGAVVGNIPKGMPSFEVPSIHWSVLLALLPSALVMALIGFMEATSISKAIATTTGERVDTNKELVGQGLANIVGSFFGSYTVSGSFSRSAVATRSGAKTGMFAIVSALAVMSVLLYFTPYLYHLPQAVLAVIVMMAVFSLIRIAPLVNAWKVDRVGASIGVITFVATLLMAPSIANGILLGIGLTVLHFLVRTMKPRAEVVSRKSDGTIGGVHSHQLQPISRYFVPVRFDGSLTFINVAYFEDMILEAHAKFPEARTILVVGSGINQIDASGEEKIREVIERLRQVNVDLVFSSLKRQVIQVLEKSGLVDQLGPAAFYADKETALHMLMEHFEGSANEPLHRRDKLGTEHVSGL